MSFLLHWNSISRYRSIFISAGVTRESRPAFTTPTSFRRTLATLTRGLEECSPSRRVPPIESGHLRALTGGTKFTNVHGRDVDEYEEAEEVEWPRGSYCERVQGPSRRVTYAWWPAKATSRRHAPFLLFFPGCRFLFVFVFFFFCSFRFSVCFFA